MDKVSCSDFNLSFLRKRFKFLPYGLISAWLNNPEFISSIESCIKQRIYIDEHIMLDIVLSIGEKEKELPMSKRHMSVSVINRTEAKIKEEISKKGFVSKALN